MNISTVTIGINLRFKFDAIFLYNMQGSARLRQGAPPSLKKPQLKAPMAGLRKDQEPLSGISEDLTASIGGLTNPGFAFTPEEPKVVVSRCKSPN